MFEADLEARAETLIRACVAAGITIATAESCTGGLVAALLTAVPGSSAVLDRGFVTYSNDAKHDMLGVSRETIAAHGAVSAETALAMASGALARSGASLSVAITGIAGPGGGTASKPVGLVHFGVASTWEPPKTVARRFGDIGRTTVRLAAVAQAIGLLEAALMDKSGSPSG